MSAFEAAKLVHVSCALLSIVGFAARFPLALRGSKLMQRRWLRIVPHVNDSLLLAAAIAMLVLAQTDPLALAWLRAKIIALGVYVAFGVVALRSTFSRTTRVCAFVLALATFAYIVGVAVTRNARGPFALFA